jgi:hypothetical protein
VCDACPVRKRAGHAESDIPDVAPVRPVVIRLGITLWILSWVPFPVIFGMDGTQRAVCWTIQVFIGIVGLALAGGAFAQTVKTVGWKRAPRVAGFVLWHGRMPDDVAATQASG